MRILTKFIEKSAGLRLAQVEMTPRAKQGGRNQTRWSVLVILTDSAGVQDRRQHLNARLRWSVRHCASMSGAVARTRASRGQAGGSIRRIKITWHAERRNAPNHCCSAFASSSDSVLVKSWNLGAENSHEASLAAAAEPLPRLLLFLRLDIAAEQRNLKFFEIRRDVLEKQRLRRDFGTPLNSASSRSRSTSSNSACASPSLSSESDHSPRAKEGSGASAIKRRGAVL